MRAHLLAIPVAAALLAPMPTQAQDATWGFMPNTSLYKDPSNWTPATVPTGTAFFGATTGPALTITGTTTTVGGWTFNSGAPAYFFAVGPGQLQFNGAGIVINAGSATPTIVTQNFGEVGFSGTSTAGSASTTLEVLSVSLVLARPVTHPSIVKATSFSAATLRPGMPRSPTAFS
jgi:hypothetical protein